MADMIFYVEDEKVVREGFESYFKRKKYDVRIFETAQEALAGLKTIQPQIIISDQKLGENSLGWQFLKDSVALSPSSIRFILSGYAESELVLNSFREGIVFDYISKSASNSEIEIKISQGCKMWHALNGKSEAIEIRDDLLFQTIITKKTVVALTEQIQQKDLEIERLERLLADKK